jgi:hypothetical protein
MNEATSDMGTKHTSASAGRTTAGGSVLAAALAHTSIRRKNPPTTVNPPTTGKFGVMNPSSRGLTAMVMNPSSRSQRLKVKHVIEQQMKVLDTQLHELECARKQQRQEEQRRRQEEQRARDGLISSITSAAARAARVAMGAVNGDGDGGADGSADGSAPRVACKTDDCMVVAMRPHAMGQVQSGW